MMKRNNFLGIIILLSITGTSVLQEKLYAQGQDDHPLTISGELFTDERVLTDGGDWAWNETRLSLRLDRQVSGNSKFHSEIWLRNMGLPGITSSKDLYNKGIIDPYNLEIREAYVRINGFLTGKLDLTIGRQRIAWGTADKLNPTDNLNPYDMEDILDFGRHRGSDAISLDYYFFNDFSFQVVFIPFFQPANMPVGIFSEVLNPQMELPPGLTLAGLSDTVLLPRFDLVESSVAGFRFKGFVGGIDFSLSYTRGMDGLPVNTKNIFIPLDTMGNIRINSELSFARTNIFGADLATSLRGMGFWAEGALFLPGKDVIMTTDLTALYPMSPVPVLQDSLILDSSKPYLKFITGTDYFFANGSYINLQYMHGFMHERGSENLNDYFFLRFEKKFYNDRLKLAPLGGGFILTDWKDIKNNYAVVYMPEIAYNATDNAEISLSASIFKGRGDNLFAQLKDLNMLIFKLKYSF